MVDRFEKVLTPEIRRAAEARGLTVRQLVTLASLVEKETAKPDERPLVAAVYSNRLKIGMGLQCDPTVIYALQRAGRYNGNLRRDDLLFDSPYNTYRYPGLPPGPIAAPGKGSLEAAASPADVDFVYFVSRNDGSHEFARTLDEHNRNVQRWQVQYFRDLRAKRCNQELGIGNFCFCLLALAPFQLRPQHFEVTARRRLDQPERRLRACHLDLRRRPAGGILPGRRR